MKLLSEAKRFATLNSFFFVVFFLKFSREDKYFHSFGLYQLQKWKCYHQIVWLKSVTVAKVVNVKKKKEWF